MAKNNQTEKELMPIWIILSIILIILPHGTMALLTVDGGGGGEGVNSNSGPDQAVLVSLSDLEQSETFLNIISSSVSVPSIEEDFHETIPISSHGRRRSYDDLSSFVTGRRTVGQEEQKRINENSKPSKKGPTKKATVTTARTAEEQGGRQKKMRRRKSSRRNDNNALSLRHEPDDNDNNLSEITNGTNMSRRRAKNLNKKIEGATAAKDDPLPRKRKVKRRRKGNGPDDDKSVPSVQEQDKERQKRRQLLRNARRKRLQEERQRRRRRQQQKDQRRRQEMAKRRETEAAAAAQEREIRKQSSSSRGTTGPGTANSGDGDLSCIKGKFLPAPRVSNSEIQYSRNAINGHENATLEAKYVCKEGHALRPATVEPLVCRNGHWRGSVPECVRIEQTELIKINESLCPSSNGLCDQLCSVNKESGEHECSCFKGFTMQSGSCQDVDECAQNVCQFGKCINTIGSFRCYCPKGFRFEGKHCVDVNECLLRNYHGPCQDACTNTHGSFRCSCVNLPDTVLGADGQRCDFQDDCEKDNAGCSHTCLTANGRAFCDCPSGWTLDPVNGKQCLDIDECASEGLSDCEFSCVNTPGSYKCVAAAVDYGAAADQPIIEEVLTCPPGFQRNYTTGSCDDEDECQGTGNGGCFDVCTNTIGSFHCSCRDGYVFAVDKVTCVVNNQSESSNPMIICAPLFPPRHGYLECTRNPVPELGGRRRVTNHLGTVCILKCPLGFHAVGTFSKICGPDGNWTGEDNGTCAKYPLPGLICPKSSRLELAANDTHGLKFQIMAPKVFDQASTPKWQIAPRPGSSSGVGFANDIVSLERGKYTVTYSVKRSSCFFHVAIEAGSPPEVVFCPEDQTLTVGNQFETAQVDWPEPQFRDNVAVTSVTPSNLPGGFGLGSHKITYTARDAAGYSSKCVFRILVRLPKWKYFNYLQLPRDI